jgi:O-antigen ligase
MMMSLSFWYPLCNLFQPGVFWPAIAPYSPLMMLSFLTLLVYLRKRREYELPPAIKHSAVRWTVALLIVRSVSLVSHGIGLAFSEFMAFLPVYVYILVSLYLIKSPQDFIRFAWGAMLGGSFLVLYGIYAVHAGLRGAYGGLAGAYGNYENHNDYSFVVLQTMPFLYLARNARNGSFKNLLLSLMVGACIYGIFLSESRGGMLALVLQIVLIVKFKFSRKAQWIILPLVFVVGLGAISVQYARRAASSGSQYTADDAESSRFELWKAGLHMFEAYPMLGVGSRLFADYSKDYGELSHDQYGKNSHNTYIQLLAELGTVGALCFVMAILGIRRELRAKLPELEAFPVEWIRMATLISFYTILFRGILDAKDRDWSWILFAVFAAVCQAHRQKYQNPLPATLGSPG